MSCSMSRAGSCHVQGKNGFYMIDPDISQMGLGKDSLCIQKV